ncbi:MAG: Sulfate permease, partial [Verrucomicrobiota bacterium]
MLRGLQNFLSLFVQGWRTLAALPRPRLLPIRSAVQQMGGPTFKADLIAGLNVALLAFPMSMAFAMKAGLPVWCGLIGCGVAALIAPIFTGSANLSAGPT